jgi:3-isopropylmalate dehydratase small subunit
MFDLTTFAEIFVANMHRAGLLLVTLLSLTPQTAVAEVMDVKIGMPMQEVLTILGEPDRKAILSGKLLRDVPENSTEIFASNSRIVFIYRHNNIQVWFRQGRVTGMTKDGVSTLPSK